MTGRGADHRTDHGPRPTGELPPAVLIGADSATGLQVARLLAARGVPVVGVVRDPGHWACRTRALHRVVALGPHQMGPEPEGLVLALRNEALFPPGCVLLPCTDQAVLALAAADGADGAALATRHRLSRPDPAAVTALVDKASFALVAERCGVATPRAALVDAGTDLAAALAPLRLPWVVKPPVKSARWLAEAPQKALKIESGPGDDPAAAVAAALGWADQLLVQEWIDGPDSALVTCNAYIAPDGRADGAVVSAKLRQWPPHTGTASAAVTVDDPAVAATTVRLLQAVGFHGLGYVEFKRRAAGGSLVAIEANVGRPTGRSAMAEAAGVDLHWALYADLAGIDRPPLGPAAPGVVWLHLRRDLQAGVRAWRRSELGPAGWVRSLRGPRVVEAVGRWRDPAPFLGDLAATATKRLGRRRPDPRPPGRHPQLDPYPEPARPAGKAAPTP